MSGTLLLATAAVLLVGWGLFIFRLASNGGNTLYDPDDYGSLCAPRRYEPLTAQPAAAPRRILAELAPPAGWRDVVHVPAPVAAQVDDFADWDLDDLDPEPLPVAVPTRPTRQPVEQPAVVEEEPVPVVVGWTAARFASLEVRR